WRTAAERFQSVLQFLESDATAMDIRGWLHYRIGLLLIYAHPEHGIHHLGEAERIGREVSDDHLSALARADRGLLRCLVGDIRRGLAEMSAGVTALDTLPALELAAGSSTVSEEPHLDVEKV